MVSKSSVRRRIGLAGCCSLALSVAAPAYAVDTDGDGIDDVIEGFYDALNNGFELPVTTDPFEFVPQFVVPNWGTNSTDGVIEIWQSGFSNVVSFEGDQHAEINANQRAALFLDAPTIPGTTITWSIAHRGRDATNTATVSIGGAAVGSVPVLVETMVTGPASWEQYSGVYTVPAGQTVTRFTFTAIDDGASGNFLDGLELTANQPDFDADGVPNYLDQDSDGDGIPDSVETAADVDGDGKPNFLDLDSDADGIPDAFEGTIDTDGDGLANFRDKDSDADAIPDIVEGTVDTDGDGDANYIDVDSDADNIPDSVEGVVDTDGDGQPDYLDSDSDNDGLPDLDEGVADTDGDGIPDFLAPPASPTAPAPNPNTDSDSDGIPDAVEGTADTDGDGQPDANDTDSDNDGIPDNVEAGADPLNPIDSDGDGTGDNLDLDSDNDGILDAAEGGSDLDGDGTANYLDLDVDNDGILDIIEARSDVDAVLLLDGDLDGVIDTAGVAFGVNGLADTVETGAETGAVNFTLADSDSDGLPDFMDLDSDNDSISDVLEMGLDDADLDNFVDVQPTAFQLPSDQDNDGVANFRDLDSDNDGLTDLIEVGGVDADSDGRIDNFNDADNDGIDDSVVASLPIDTDGDGLQDQLDLDSDQDSLPDLTESGGTDSDANGLVDSFIDDDNDGLSDTLLTSPLLANDSDGDGFRDFQDLDSNDDGEFDLVSAGFADADNDGMVDNFVDPDNDGLSGANPAPVAPPSEPGTIITGVDGGFGCTVGNGRSVFDPLFPGMLLLAGFGMLVSRRKKDSDTPEEL